MLNSVKAYLKNKQVFDSGERRDVKETVVVMNELIADKRSLSRLKCLKDFERMLK
jgi:hypothetical protein